MTQSASIYDDLSVRANLRYFARVQGLRSPMSTGCSSART